MTETEDSQIQNMLFVSCIHIFATACLLPSRIHAPTSYKRGNKDESELLEEAERCSRAIYFSATEVDVKCESERKKALIFRKVKRTGVIESESLQVYFCGCTACRWIRPIQSCACSCAAMHHVISPTAN